MRAKVRELVRCGADQIKFATTGGASGRSRQRPTGPGVTHWMRQRRWLTRPQPWDAAPSATRWGAPAYLLLSRAGAGSIEHGCYLATDPDMLKMMADQGTFFNSDV